MTDPIQSLWIGGELSPMEQLSIASFLAHGHEYHLYSYGEVGRLPKGAVLKNAEEILPKTAIFQYRQHPSYAGFSNFFRYRLLLRKGGWWVDTDVVCLKPFAFDAPYVFAAERIHRRRSGGERGDQGAGRQRNHGLQLARLFVLRGPCRVRLGASSAQS